jgi:hypothetical protein
MNDLLNFIAGLVRGPLLLIPGLLALSGLIVRETREFFSWPEWREVVAQKTLRETN